MNCIVDTILNLFTCETWIYILSISLQVTGAICLIMNYWGNVEDKVTLSYYAGGEIPKAQDNNKVRLKKDKLQSCVKDIYMNRFSFICIIIGYGVGIFGNITDGSNKLYVLSAICLFCVVLTCTGRWVSSLVSKKVYKDDREVDREKIEKVADVQWSDKEQKDFIDGLFKDN